MGGGVTTVELESLEKLEARRTPITTWLQFANLATLAVVSLLVFRLYRALVRFFVWITTATPDCDDIRTILFLGPKTELNQTLLQELSRKFDTPVSQLKEGLSGVWTGRRVLINGGDWAPHDRDEILRLSQGVTSTYGPVDLLIVSDQRQQSTQLHNPPDFLAQINQQLLTQFWVVTAFLPGMLSRNKGSILSVALDRTSSLANAGVMRTVFEDVAQKGSRVVLTLVERNHLVERILPALPDPVLARLTMEAIGRSEVVVLPSAIDYVFTVPVLLGRMYLKPFFDFLWSPSTRSPRRHLR